MMRAVSGPGWLASLAIITFRGAPARADRLKYVLRGNRAGIAAQ